MSFVLTFMLGFTVYADTLPSFPVLDGYDYKLVYKEYSTNNVFLSLAVQPFQLVKINNNNDLAYQITNDPNAYQYKLYKYDGSSWVFQGDYWSQSHSIGPVASVVSSNILFSSNDLYLNSSVFFSPPIAPILPIMEVVKPSLQTMGGSLVSPILLKTGLAVLAILLGVQLVPRLIHSLVH